MDKKKTHQWIVPEDHPFFKGHFPGDPVLPSIALIEQCFELIKTESEQELHLVQIHKAKFKIMYIIKGHKPIPNVLLLILT